MSAGETLEHYAEVLRLAEQQASLATAGEIDALEPLNRRWQELVATLPARPPAGAAALLQRAFLISQRTQAQLAELQQALMQDVAATAKASRVAHGYTLRRRHRRVDHCV